MQVCDEKWYPNVSETTHCLLNFYKFIFYKIASGEAKNLFTLRMTKSLKKQLFLSNILMAMEDFQRREDLNL